MPYFKNDNVNILFIHIPKTGGSSVESYFSSKFNIPLNNDSLFDFIDNQKKINENIIINSSLQHITYNQMIQYNKVFNIDFNNIKIMTIVRNPYQRIISDLFWSKKININTSKKEVFNIIEEYLPSDKYDNHNIPQHIFITDDDKKIIPNIHILRTETLTNNMRYLGYDDFNNFINNNTEKVNYYNYLNNDSIRVINDFYHYDFVLFNYPKIFCEKILCDTNRYKIKKNAAKNNIKNIFFKFQKF
jgi:hypothetical protein